MYVIDFIKVNPSHWAEVRFYYENNWAAYRKEALKQGFITGYQLIELTSDTAEANLLLITTYADSAAYHGSEANFRKIIDTLSPSGPKLLNEVKPAAFRKNLRFQLGAPRLGTW